MSNTPIRLASSTDSQESAGSPMSHSSFAKATIARLKEQLKVLDLITTPPVVSSSSSSAQTILNVVVLIDIYKFIDSMLQANIMMIRSFS